MDFDASEKWFVLYQFKIWMKPSSSILLLLLRWLLLRFILRLIDHLQSHNDIAFLEKATEISGIPHCILSVQHIIYYPKAKREYQTLYCSDPNGIHNEGIK